MFKALGRIKGQIPMLKELRIHGFDLQPPIMGDTFVLAPSLDTAFVDFQVGFGRIESTLFLPFHQLRANSGDRYTEIDNHLSDLRVAASTLVDCSLTTRGPSYPILNPEPLDLPCLARLSVSNSHFLDYLVTPSLQALCGQKSRYSRITTLSFGVQTHQICLLPMRGCKCAH